MVRELKYPCIEDVLATTRHPERGRLGHCRYVNKSTALLHGSERSLPVVAAYLHISSHRLVRSMGLGILRNGASTYLHLIRPDVSKDLR